MAAACALLLLGQGWPASAGAASGLAAAGSLEGFYRAEGPASATLEVRRGPGGEYVVRLEGGSPPGLGAAAPADCTVEARGVPDGPTLRARFGPVETDTASYGADQAAREGRTVEIAFTDRGTAEVLAADTFGYCGLGAEFRGRYRRER